MATTQEKEDERLGSVSNEDFNRMWYGQGRNGDGGNQSGDGQYPPERNPPPEGYWLGVQLTVASITVMFLALSVAYVVNRARLQPMATPRAIYFSTITLAISSATIECARYALKQRRETKFKIWMTVTTALGILFLCFQLIAWRQLAAFGFYLNRNTHSGYAYIFTVLHALHLIGGLMALNYVTLKSPGLWTSIRRRVSIDAVALYWHFLDGLWIYLLIIIFFWK